MTNRLIEGVAVRIEPGNSNIPPIPGRKPGRVAQRSSTSSLSSSGETPTESESVASIEVAALMAGLDDVPEIRSELVEEVRRRLGRGDHLTRAAAEQTAAAILADLASFIGQ